MRRISAWGLVAAGLAGTACTSLGNGSPQAMPLGEMSTTATYDVLGNAEGTSSGMVLLWFFPIGLEDKIGQGVAEEPKGPLDAIAEFFAPVAIGPRLRNAAMYNAIEAHTGADAIVFPRFETESTNYILFATGKARCHGKAIRINPSKSQ